MNPQRLTLWIMVNSQIRSIQRLLKLYQRGKAAEKPQLSHHWLFWRGRSLLRQLLACGQRRSVL